MLRDVPLALLISDKNVTRKYSRYALNLVFVLIDVYFINILHYVCVIKSV